MREPTAPSRPTRRRPSRARIATTLIFLANGSGIGAWAACIPAMKLRLGLTDSALGLGLLAFAAGAIVAMPVAGWLGVRFGSRDTTVVAASLFALALVLPGLAGSLAVLIPAALVLGAVNGVCDVAMNAHGAAVEREWGGAIMSSFHAAFSLGGLSGSIGAGVLLAQGLPLADCFAVATVWVGLLVAVACATGLGSGLAVPAAGESSVGFAWPSRALLAIGLLAFLSMLIEGAMADWSGVFLVSVAGAAVATGSAGYAAFSVAMVACRLLGDRIVRALGEAPVLRAGGLLAAGGLALALAAAQPAASGIGFGLVGLGMANVIPVLFSAAGRSRGMAPSIGVSMAATLGYAGFLIGPPVIGLAADLIGLRVALLVLVAAALVIAALAGAILGRRSVAQAVPSRVAT